MYIYQSISINQTQILKAPHEHKRSHIPAQPHGQQTPLLCVWVYIYIGVYFAANPCGPDGGTGQARERVRAPAAAAPTRPAGWGAWLQIGFAARAFCWLFRWLLLCKNKTRPRFGKQMLSVSRFAKY